MRPSGADVDDPGISVELNALNASSSVKGHSHQETETTENENNELSQKDQGKHDKDDFTVFSQHLKSRSLKTKKASTETGSSAQSNLLRKDERKKGPSNSEGIYCKK